MMVMPAIFSVLVVVVGPEAAPVIVVSLRKIAILGIVYGAKLHKFTTSSSHTAAVSDDEDDGTDKARSFSI